MQLACHVNKWELPRILQPKGLSPDLNIPTGPSQTGQDVVVLGQMFIAVFVQVGAAGSTFSLSSIFCNGFVPVSLKVQCLKDSISVVS